MFVAVHGFCDKSCWYCTEHGENRTVEGRLATPRLLEILGVAYGEGIKVFRFTGGEPTLRQDLRVLLRETQEFGPDVRIAMTTNGANLDELVDVIATLEEPRIFISIDGLADVEKPLTSALRQTIDTLIGIARVRLNFVLTRNNAAQLWPLIDYAVEKRIDLKIFELLLRDYYYAGQRPPEEVFAERYVSVRTVLPELARRFGSPSRFAGTGGRGIPMFAFRTGSSRIVYFDSQRGSHYGTTCETCRHYPCQEGLYALLLDVNGMLHPAGCENRELYIPLGVRDERSIADSIQQLLAVIEESSMRPVLPAVLNRAVASQ